MLPLDTPLLEHRSRSQLRRSYDFRSRTFYDHNAGLFTNCTFHLYVIGGEGIVIVQGGMSYTPI